MALTSTPRNTPLTPQRASWLFSLITGALTVVAVVYGGYLAACGGIFNAMVFTVLLFVLFMPVLPTILMGVIAGVLGVAVTVRWLSASVWMSARIELLAFLLPFIGMVLGWLVGWQVGSPNACVLKM